MSPCSGPYNDDTLDTWLIFIYSRCAIMCVYVTACVCGGIWKEEAMTNSHRLFLANAIVGIYYNSISH